MRPEELSEGVKAIVAPLYALHIDGQDIARLILAADRAEREKERCKVIDAMVIVLPSGQPCYRTFGDVPQRMPRKTERIVRRFLKRIALKED